MTSADDYLNLVTSEHKQKPLFTAALAALVAGAVDAANVAADLVNKFDLDLAVGVQLDDVGRWVGLSRRLRTPLTGVYFEWDGAADVGWESGIWQGVFDPTTGLVSLPDDIYRILLRAKIAANHWDGTIPGAILVWETAFNGGQSIVIQDNQDMTMVIGFVGPPLSAVEQALLVDGYLPLKPAGVRISYYAIPVNEGPIFAWDAESPELDGWDIGSWPIELLPT